MQALACMQIHVHKLTCKSHMSLQALFYTRQWWLTLVRCFITNQCFVFWKKKKSFRLKEHWSYSHTHKHKQTADHAAKSSDLTWLIYQVRTTQATSRYAECTLHHSGLSHNNEAQLEWPLTYRGTCVGAYGDEEALMCFDMGRTLQKTKVILMCSRHVKLLL